nr:hypothetical protein [uncultured Flavobacterium sp.]
MGLNAATTRQYLTMKFLQKILPIILLIPILCNGQETQLKGDNIKITLGGDTTLELSREKFNPKKHKIEYKDTHIVSIDNIPIFGSDTEVPKYILSKAVLKKGNKIYNLQIDNMYNPWLDAVADEKLYEIICGNEGACIVKARFSEGEGKYAAEWLIDGNASIRDMITKDAVIIQSYFEYSNGVTNE